MGQFETFFKKFVSMPTIGEVILFAVIAALLILVIRIFHYTEIRRRVQAESRCYREKNSMQNGRYVVLAKNPQNRPMYSVSYDLGASKYAVECACKSGENINTFKNILVYDPISKQKRTVDKNCSCETNFINNGDDPSKAFYSGHSGVIRFMLSGGQYTDVFRGVAA